MALSAFGEKAFMPDDEMLAVALLERKAIWDNIIEHIENTYSNISTEWKFYTKAAGWTYVIKSGKRTLIYLIPRQDCIKTSFVFGEKAVEAAKDADLPDFVLATILEAKVYAEGRSFMADVIEAGDIRLIETLLKIKDDN